MPRYARRLALLAGSLLAAVLAAELLLRVLDPFHTGEVLAREAFQRAILEPHPERPQAILRAGARARFLGADVEINADRMRGPRVPIDKPPGVFRVLVVGDSIAFGWGVAEADCFPRVLERMLNDGPRPAGVERFEVVNGGTPGWDLPAYYLFLQESGLRYRPDLVLVTFINNDLTEIIRVVEGDAAAPDPLLHLPRWAEGSYVARAVKDVHDIVAGAKGDFFLELESAPQIVDPAIDMACELFGRMAALCGDVPMAVVDTLGDDSGNRLQRFVDCLAASAIPRIEAFLPRATYARDYAVSAIDMHPNAAGHRRFAEWIAAWIRSELFG